MTFWRNESNHERDTERDQDEIVEVSEKRGEGAFRGHGPRSASRDELARLPKEIEELRGKVLAGDAQRKADLTAAEEKYVAALAECDRAYAQEIAVCP